MSIIYMILKTYAYHMMLKLNCTTLIRLDVYGFLLSNYSKDDVDMLFTAWWKSI